MKATVKILRNDRNVPQGKLADAELHFTGGELDGLKLIGFAVWVRRDGNGRNVTFPARAFTVHGERRSFALLRAIGDRTELEGSYDITLDYVLDQPVGQPSAAPQPSASAPDGPSLFTALEEQLGLKLEPTKAAVEVFVVDSVTQPEPD